MQKSPPRFVPTLTQVVTGTPATMPSQPASATGEASRMSASANISTGGLPVGQPLIRPVGSTALVQDVAQQLRQQLLVRTRQYMDIELQRRIRETVSQLALEHAHKLFEEIQPQLEATISQVVEEAVQQAIAHAVKHSVVNAP